MLGIVGAGGLGFQLSLSFISLRYDEMWTLLWALIILSVMGIVLFQAVVVIERVLFPWSAESGQNTIA